MQIGQHNTARVRNLDNIFSSLDIRKYAGVPAPSDHILLMAMINMNIIESKPEHHPQEELLKIAKRVNTIADLEDQLLDFKEAFRP